MKKLMVNAQTKEYPIYIGEGFDRLGDCFAEAGLKGEKACIVTDSNVADLYLEEVKRAVSGCFSHICIYVFLAGEESKTLHTIECFYQRFLENKLDRKSVVIALGGGVAGDMAGFAAATYMRGIQYVQIPTTLLSQVDSSVGGKTGVNFMNVKNVVGAFYQPDFVYMNVNVLKTLPNQQFISGMGEVIKHAFIQNLNYLSFLYHNHEKILQADSEIMQTLIYESCKIKARVVSEDEKESGLREILNFGHTFGHALETLSELTLPHGVCVGIGMCAALYLSHFYGYITIDELKQSEKLLQIYQMPTSVRMDEKITPNSIYELMAVDKKTKNGNITLVILNKMGDAFTHSNAAKEEIMKAIHYIVKE